MKHKIITALLIAVTAITTATATANYMIKTAEPDFANHTIEWCGQVHEYE